MSQTDLNEEPRPRVLLIEDSSVDRLWLRSRLSADGLDVHEARDGLSGLDACRAQLPDLILLDLNLPLCDGFEILRRLKGDRRTSSVPVIVVSAASRPMDKALGLDLGAVDFVTKPFDIVELRARIRVALRTKRLQELLEQRANLDGLTGLSNRLALEDRLSTEWAIRQRHGAALALWVVDLDRFKTTNDAYGHAAGDEVLRRAASMLRSTIRATDLAARYGGDEFVVIAPFCDVCGAVNTAERFRSRLANMSIPAGQNVMRPTVSIGVASAPNDGIHCPADLIARADQALYQAKASGRDCVHAWRGAPPDDRSSGERLLAAR